MPNNYRTKSLLPPSNLATNQTANLQCLLQYPRCAAFVCSMVEQTTPRCVLCLLQCRTDWEEFFWSPDRIVVATRAKRTVSGGVVHIDILPHCWLKNGWIIIPPRECPTAAVMIGVLVCADFSKNKKQYVFPTSSSSSWPLLGPCDDHALLNTRWSSDRLICDASG